MANPMPNRDSIIQYSGWVGLISTTKGSIMPLLVSESCIRPESSGFGLCQPPPLG